MQSFPVFQASLRIRKHGHFSVHKGGILHTVFRGNNRALVKLFFFYAGQIQCHTLSGFRNFRVLLMYLNVSNPRFQSFRIDLQCISLMERSRDKGSRNNGSKSLQAEHAVNRKTRNALGISFRKSLYHFGNRLFTILNSLSRNGGYANHGGFFQDAPFQLFLNILLHHRNPFRIHSITLCQHQDTFFNTEELQDIQMLSCLRHDSFIGGHNHKYHVHPHYTGDHLLNKLLMSGYINDSAA